MMGVFSGITKDLMGEARCLIEEFRRLSLGLPDAADDFVDSCGETVESIDEQMDDRGFVTQKQVQVLENILDGCYRWVDHDD